ncbi:MAG TPA: two-component sensor histidine kinase [Gammaproteobacteria bacterium]|nr:two-component sensor histidine kinase [Gammaproteobacteria bacterium]
MVSIRSRTLLLVLGLLSLSLTLISYQSYQDAYHEIEELFDAQMAQHARLLAGMVSHDMTSEAGQALQQALDRAVAATEGNPQTEPFGHKYENKLGFLVLDERGKTLLQSTSTIGQLAQSLGRRDNLPVQGEDNYYSVLLSERLIGYHDALLHGDLWRLFILHDQRNNHWILVSERQDIRGELAEKIALRSLLPDLVGLPLLALLVWLAIGWGLRPLGRMAQLLKSRDPDNLAPLQLAPLPQELMPVVASLNRLLMQVMALLEREKRFLADAAHELRTPLAVLRIHTQNALQAPDPTDREQALQQLDAGIERATRVIAQLLTLARLEPNAVTLRMTELDLLAFLRNELAELIPLALERQQDLALEATEGDHDCLIADAPSLGILLQNLISNAVQHTPKNGQIRVCLQVRGEAVELRIQDSGPGIPPELRSKVFERFFRQGAAQGAGLGLSIVARIVELHGGTLELHDSPLGGLEVLICLSRLPRSAGAMHQAGR